MTINEQEFDKMCGDAHADIDGVTGHAERYAALVEAVFPRLCAYLGLDPARQRGELRGGAQDDYGFYVIQTVEEHMEPAFDYGRVLKAHV